MLRRHSRLQHSDTLHQTAKTIYCKQVIGMWKEASKLKDLKIDELHFQLGQAATQLAAAQKLADTQARQLAELQARLATAEAAAAAAAERGAAKADALQSQLRSKELSMASAEVRCAALEAELRSANTRAASLQRQVSHASKVLGERNHLLTYHTCWYPAMPAAKAVRTFQEAYVLKVGGSVS